MKVGRLKTGLVVAATIVLLAQSSNLIRAQGTQYPTKAVTIVVPYPPGILPDAIGRLVAAQLQKTLGKPFIVENKTGASGAIGAEFVARSNPDGYTLLSGDAGQMAIVPATKRGLGYDPLRDFVPVSMVAATNQYLYVRSGLGVSNFQELIALAKAKPDTLKYGTPGVASLHHLHIEHLAKQAGIKLIHVPYRSGAQYMPALFNEEIDLAFAGLFAVGIQDGLKAGKAKILAVSGRQRDFQEKDYPTLIELGLPDVYFGYEAVIYAPAKTPADVVKKLAGEISRAVQTPKFSKFLTNINMEPKGLSGDVVNKTFSEDYSRYQKLIAEIGFVVE